MATGAAAEVKKNFLDQPLNAFMKNIEDDLKEGKYDIVKSGITIANDIMNEFITTSISAIGVTRIGFGGNAFPFLVSEFVDFLVFLVFPFAFTRSTTFAQQFLFGCALFSVEQRAFWTSE